MKCTGIERERCMPLFFYESVWRTPRGGSTLTDSLMLNETNREEIEDMIRRLHRSQARYLDYSAAFLGPEELTFAIPLKCRRFTRASVTQRWFFNQTKRNFYGCTRR
jgi:hypothetical protein